MKQQRRMLVRFWPFDDKPLDAQRRRMWVAEWEDLDGIYHRERSVKDGKPVGYRRGQVFFTTEAWLRRTWKNARLVQVVRPAKPFGSYLRARPEATRRAESSGPST